MRAWGVGQSSRAHPYLLIVSPDSLPIRKIALALRASHRLLGDRRLLIVAAGRTRVAVLNHVLLRFRLDVHREHGCRSVELVHGRRTGVRAAVKTADTALG